MAVTSTRITMKKIVSTLLITAATLPSICAVPALVWKNGISNANNAKKPSPVHRSAEISSSQLLHDALSVESSSSSNSDNISVVFMVGRTSDGAEGLTSLTTGGSLPGVSQKYTECETIHHHVSKMESLHTVTKDCQKASGEEKSVVFQASLDEFASKLESLNQPKDEIEMEVGPSGMVSKAVQAQTKRSRALEAARVLIVDVPASTDGSRLDMAVLSAVDSPRVQSVVLSAVRSIDEVKHERDQLARRRMMEQKDSTVSFTPFARMQKNHRRLEDAAEQQDDGQFNNNNGDQDMSGIYYVHMTPNILAGLLFTLLFIVATWIGISCMGMIAGQDCYVNKMPTIGREA